MKREKTSPWVIALAWTAALVPLMWGLLNTFKKAMPLFGG